MGGGLPTGDSLRRRNIADGTCFFFTIVLSCSWNLALTLIVSDSEIYWKFIYAVWFSLTGVFLNDLTHGFLHKWVQFLFDYLRFWVMA